MAQPNSHSFASYVFEFKDDDALTTTPTDTSILLDKNVAWMNALRNVMMGHIPNMALTNITIHTNESLVDHFALLSKLEMIVLRSEVVVTTIMAGKNVFVGEVPLEIDVTCPEDATDVLEVSSFDMVVCSSVLDTLPTEIQQSPPLAADDIHLLNVKPGKRFHATMTASIGVGELHAKWSHVANTSYVPRAIVIVNSDALQKHCSSSANGLTIDAFMNTCPLGVFDIEDVVSSLPSKRNVVVMNEDKCNMCMRCVQYIGQPNEATTVTAHKSAKQGELPLPAASPPMVDIQQKHDVFGMFAHFTGSASPEWVMDVAMNMMNAQYPEQTQLVHYRRVA